MRAPLPFWKEGTLKDRMWFSVMVACNHCMAVWQSLYGQHRCAQSWAVCFHCAYFTPNIKDHTLYHWIRTLYKKRSRFVGHLVCSFCVWLFVLLIVHHPQVYTSHGPTVIMPTWFCSRDWFCQVGPFDEGGKVRAWARSSAGHLSSEELTGF